MLWHLIAGALVAAAVGAGGAWKVQAWRWAAADAERLQSEQRDALRRQEAAFGAAERFERDRQAIRTQIQTVTVEVPRVVERPVYRAECWDADGLRLVTQAIGASADPAQPDGPMPAASVAR